MGEHEGGWGGCPEAHPRGKNFKLYLQFEDGNANKRVGILPSGRGPDSLRRGRHE